MTRRNLAGLASASLLAAASPADAKNDGEHSWQETLSDRLALFGHRNWIVVADSAYPAQSRASIETIISGADHLSVLRAVSEAIKVSKHVRPIVHLDAELPYVPEAEAPGIDHTRSQIKEVLGSADVQSSPHEQIIAMLDQAGQQFDILIIKTNLTIAYTSVFFELRAAYWSDEAEKKLRNLMPAR